MTISMGSFCKTEDCPASDVLLAFQTGDTDIVESRDVRRHLRDCEFCATEVEFYGLYPPVEEKVLAGAVPAPLFELAEALLQRKRDLTPLYTLIRDD